MKRIINYALIMIALLASCDNGNEEEPAVLTTIEVTSQNGGSSILDSQSLTLVVSGFDQNEEPIQVNDLSFISANESIATVNQSGIVSGESFGKTAITVRSGSVSQLYDIKVLDSSLPNMEIFVSDAGQFSTGPWKIVKYDRFGENPVVFTDENIAWPQDIVFHEDKVLVSNLSSGEITEYNVQNGQYLGVFASVTGGPTRMKIGPDNLLYVLQWGGNGRVLRYNLDGSFVDQFTSEAVDQSIGIDWDAGGNLYVSSYNMGSNGFIRRFNSNGNDLGVFINSNLQGPTDIWFDDNNQLLVNDYTGNSVKKFTGNSFVETIITGISNPEGIQRLENGYFFLGSSGSGLVKLYNENNSFRGDWITPSGIVLLAPNAVSIRIIN